MNKKLKKLLLFSIILALISTVSFCSAPFDTESAEMINIRKTVSGEGIILRNETIVKAPSNGVFEPKVNDGHRSSKGSSLGVIISGNFDEDLVRELKDVTARIEEIENSGSFSDIYSSDEARIFTALKNFSSSIRENVRLENYISANEDAAQLNAILTKKSDIEGQGAEDDLLLSLQQRKFELERQLGGIREEVYSPASGQFYTKLDGLEMNIKESNLFDISPTKISDYRDTLSNHSESPDHIGKIVDTYSWYLVAIIPESEAKLLTLNSHITLSVDEAPEVDAVVSAMNYDSANRCAVVLKATHDVKDIFEKRNVSFEICYENKSGLYVPAAAIRVVDGVTGVYILKQNETASFRSVKVLLKEDSYFIVANNYTPAADVKYPPLKMYDNILVNPEVLRPNEIKK